MVNKVIKCGNSSAVSIIVRIEKPDEAANAKKVSIHFGSCGPVVERFRVLVHLVDGTEVLLGLADTREEAARLCWARTTEMPLNATRLALERWEGDRTSGRWVSVATEVDELPRLAPPVRAKKRRNRRL
jgi:hypothetical protein